MWCPQHGSGTQHGGSPLVGRHPQWREGDARHGGMVSWVQNRGKHQDYLSEVDVLVFGGSDTQNPQGTHISLS
jgi:hypothetical protein